MGKSTAYLLFSLIAVSLLESCFIIPTNSSRKSIKKFKYYDPDFNLDNHNSNLRTVEEGFYQRRRLESSGYEQVSNFYFFKNGVLHYWPTGWEKGSDMERDNDYFCNDTIGSSIRKYAPSGPIYGFYALEGKDSLLFTKKAHADRAKKFVAVVYEGGDSIVVTLVKDGLSLSYVFVPCENEITPVYWEE